MVKIEETATKVIERLPDCLTPADPDFQGWVAKEQLATERSGLELAKMARDKTRRPVVVLLDRGTFFYFFYHCEAVHKVWWHSFDV